MIGRHMSQDMVQWLNTVKTACEMCKVRSKECLYQLADYQFLKEHTYSKGTNLFIP